MNDKQKLEQLAADAFSSIQFESIEVVDRVRDMNWSEDKVDGQTYQHGEGSFFGVSIEKEDAESEKFSFHCLILDVNGQPRVISAYVYDLRTGNEIATLEV